MRAGDRRPGSARQPRRLGEIIAPAMRRLTTGDEARAFAAWARASGPQLAGTTAARAYHRGVLTVDCESSVWANELTYLQATIIARMDELDPGQPIERLRFIVRSHRTEQEEEPAASKSHQRETNLREDDLSEARRAVGAVADQRLRAAIEAALRRTRDGDA
jgi:predicted nucleic acid-binding Zn ribbon protein